MMHLKAILFLPPRICPLPHTEHGLTCRQCHEYDITPVLPDFPIPTAPVAQKIFFDEFYMVPL